MIRADLLHSLQIISYLFTLRFTKKVCPWLLIHYNYQNYNVLYQWDLLNNIFGANLVVIKSSSGTHSLQCKLTHGFELPNELLLAPLGPLLSVGVDGAEDRTAWLPAVIHRRYIQVVYKHNVGVLWKKGHAHKNTGMTSTLLLLFIYSSSRCYHIYKGQNKMIESIYWGSGKGGNWEGKWERKCRSGRRSDIACQIRFSHLAIKDLTAWAHSSLSLTLQRHWKCLHMFVSPSECACEYNFSILCMHP